MTQKKSYKQHMLETKRKLNMGYGCVFLAIASYIHLLRLIVEFIAE